MPSYIPLLSCVIVERVSDPHPKQKRRLSVFLVGMSGLEPPTPTLSGWCSNLLSYIPLYYIVVEISGLEPLTSCLQSRRSTN